MAEIIDSLQTIYSGSRPCLECVHTFRCVELGLLPNYAYHSIVLSSFMDLAAIRSIHGPAKKAANAGPETMSPKT